MMAPGPGRIQPAQPGRFWHGTACPGPEKAAQLRSHLAAKRKIRCHMVSCAPAAGFRRPSGWETQRVLRFPAREGVEPGLRAAGRAGAAPAGPATRCNGARVQGNVLASAP